MSVIIDPGTGKKKFDLRVDIRDPKTGQVIKHQPYSMRVDKVQGQVFTRNGVEYWANGDRLDGKVEKPKSIEGKPPKPAKAEGNEGKADDAQ